MGSVDPEPASNDEQAVVSRRRRRRGGNDLEHRASLAFNLIQVGDLFCRQALEGAEIALGTFGQFRLRPAFFFELGRQPESPNVHISSFRPSKTPT